MPCCKHQREVGRKVLGCRAKGMYVEAVLGARARRDECKVQKEGGERGLGAGPVCAAAGRVQQGVTA